jgi:hypothetical protein
VSSAAFEEMFSLDKVRLLREATEAARRQAAAQLAQFRVGVRAIGAAAFVEPLATEIRAIVRNLREIAGPFE